MTISTFLKSALALWAFVSLPGAVLAGTYYIAVDGDDSATGAIDDPWTSLDEASQRLRPGDTLLARAGVYAVTKPLEIAAEGSEEAWITIAGYPGEEAIFDGTGYKPAKGEHDLGLIEVNGSSYLRLRNLSARNSHGMGFHIVYPSHHVDIIECSSDNTYGPGIGVWGIPKTVTPIQYVRVIGNDVTRANLVSMEIYPGPSEPPHEAISIAGVHHFEVAQNHVRDCGKEGIDVKEYSSHGRVHHNHVHNVARQGLYVDAWFGTLENVTLDHNRVYDNEWGIVISCEGPASELRDIYIHNNHFSGHRASGLYFGLWGGDRFREKIFIYNNTFVDNGSIDHWSGPTGNIDLRSSNVAQTYVFNNLCSGGAAFEIATFIPPEQWEKTGREKSIVVTRNLIAEHRDRTREASYPESYGRNYATRGQLPVEGDPELMAVEPGVYLPVRGSPAWGAGLMEAPNGLKAPGLSSNLGAVDATAPPQTD